MNFLRDVLGRPSHEQAFVLVVAGVPAPDATVPTIEKRPLDDLARFVP